ncbi:hypothetical protein ACOME3_003554 [Neoechinorhynchus agilis]
MNLRRIFSRLPKLVSGDTEKNETGSKESGIYLIEESALDLMGPESCDFTAYNSLKEKFKSMKTLIKDQEEEIQHLTSVIENLENRYRNLYDEFFDKVDCYDQCLSIAESYTTSKLSINQVHDINN